MKTLLIFSAFVATLSSSVQGVDLGETCNPTIPNLWCDTTKNIQCVDYACECVTGFVSREDGKGCFRTYDELCHYPLSGPEPRLTCNSDRGLDCDPGTVIYPYGNCKCLGRSQTTFDIGRGSCVGLSGAQCDPTATTIFGDICVPNAQCDEADSTCKCKEGFVTNNDKKCEKINGSLGSTCDENPDCDWDVLHLECGDKGVCECAGSKNWHLDNAGGCVRDFGTECTSLTTPGLCRCKSEENQEYNEETNECVSIVDVRCGDSPTNPDIKCIDNAVCQPQNGSYDRCVCNEGFLSTHDRRECLQISGPLPGEACDPTGTPWQHDSNSVCTDGTCQCPPNKFPNQEGTRCYQKHGEICSDITGPYCNEDRWMNCRLGRCSCDIVNDEVYDAERDSCMGLVRSKCTVGNSTWDLICPPNAYCQPTPNPNVARCNEGYEEAVDGRACTPITLY